MQGCQMVFQFRKSKVYHCKFLICYILLHLMILWKKKFNHEFPSIIHSIACLHYQRESYLEYYQENEVNKNFWNILFICFTSQNTDCGRHFCLKVKSMFLLHNSHTQHVSTEIIQTCRLLRLQG